MEYLYCIVRGAFSKEGAEMTFLLETRNFKIMPLPTDQRD